MEPRLEPLDPATLDPDQLALYEEITVGPRAQDRKTVELTDASGRLRGPFNAMLLSPTIGLRLQALGAAVRYASSCLTDRERELATIMVAAHWGSDFELDAHRVLAESVGIEPDVIDDVLRGLFESVTDPREQAVCQVVRHLLRFQLLTDEQYAEATDALDTPSLFEITVLVGYYGLLALQLRIFGGEGPWPTELDSHANG